MFAKFINDFLDLISHFRQIYFLKVMNMLPNDLHLLIARFKPSSNTLLFLNKELKWQHVLAVCSVIFYIAVSLYAVMNAKIGLYSPDSILMTEMARGDRVIGASRNPSYILFLRFTIETFGLGSIVYFHLLLGATTSFVLAWVIGKDNLLSWSGFWILSLPSYLVFNLMVWKDVTFLYLIVLAVALIIKSDKDKFSKNYCLIIVLLLTAICLTRLNGGLVVIILIMSFLLNKKHIRIKLILLAVSLFLALGINSFVKRFYHIEKSNLTTSSLVKRVIENDYLYYMLCVKNEKIDGMADNKNKIFSGLPSYCDSSFTLDVAKNSLPIEYKNAIVDKSVKLFSSKPHLWLYIKYKQTSQYLFMKSAYIFPAYVMRLNFIKSIKTKDTVSYKRIVRFFLASVVLSFIPAWIILFVLYVAVRGVYFKVNTLAADSMQRDVLLPVSIFVFLYYLSLSIPSMTNDVRYFLPAVYISIFFSIVFVSKDLESLALKLFDYIKSRN